MRETFRPLERLRKKRDFESLYSTGNRYHGRYIILIFNPNNLNLSRLGVVVSKKHGGAVRRNRIKRWIRTLFRRNKDLLKTPLDLLIIPKKPILEIPWARLEEDYRAAIRHVTGPQEAP